MLWIILCVTAAVALLLEGGLGKEERVGEHDKAVDDGDGAHGEASVAPRSTPLAVVVPRGGEYCSNLLRTVLCCALDLIIGLTWMLVALTLDRGGGLKLRILFCIRLYFSYCMVKDPAATNRTAPVAMKSSS